ncbi:sigma-54-dependent transcriptional regulator [Massilia endophytica]|uniref:sigma-54-dependent transcriptional regulator n=1 Tax=Massilia endophytica TaxID=2899220 RepID=UPI001E3118E5|nr:sigma-54 dependent transcriptional regulator [Massilia endophytica]UGQ45373.1 sigma-54 dependent transcriptional regulator [Massilia endophytica]
MNAQAILVEDEASLRLATAQTLELGGFSVQACSSAEEALALLRADFGGVLVTDVRLPGRSGLELLAQAVALDAELPVIVVTGHGDVSMAVEAMRSGAYDFIEKPFASERLMDAVRRAQERRNLVLENRQLRTARALHPDTPDLIGRSPAMEQLKLTIRNVGPAGVDILINGQTGTGKEVVARVLHAASGRKGNFVAINCGALPESVFESEIFGHEPGAFTGAQKRRVGKLEYANGGTVFLDEIETMPMSLQVKLLRVLQERRLERLGANEAVPLDCRVIAASKANLLQLSAEGRFREDLYYRIGVVTIDLPRLNERRDDIPLLLAHFVQEAALRYQRPLPQWSAQDMAAWQAADWPGNVRELRNFAERLTLGLAPQAAAAQAAEYTSGSLPQQVDAYERDLILRALAEADHNVGIAADRLMVPRKTLYDKMKKYQISTGRK